MLIFNLHPGQPARKLVGTVTVHRTNVSSTTNRIAELDRLLRERIVVLDGAMGTMIQSHKLDEAAFRGARLRNGRKTSRG